jgi:GNAT superfamily N-acetyltransferase
MSRPTIMTRCGEEILPYLDAAAHLRIEVFREYPYLYEGSLESEEAYLKTYARCPQSIFVLVQDGGETVGISTGLPLANAVTSFQKPFLQAHVNLDEIFYLGESVLRKNYRGQGIGHEFFDKRETHARKLGCLQATFCAVVRPAWHPLKPQIYFDNHALWHKRGYEPSELYSTLSWKQVDSILEQENQLQFWINRELRSSFALLQTPTI